MEGRYDWEQDGVNYWDNPDCPREHLEQALIDLVEFVEDVYITRDQLRVFNDKQIRRQIEFYEGVADK